MALIRPRPQVLFALGAAFLLLSGTGKGHAPKLKKPWAERFAYIPPDTFEWLENEPLSCKPGRKITYKGFFIAKWEVSNGEYLQFTSDIQKKGDTVLYRSMLPDTLRWMARGAGLESYVGYYFRHPQYEQGPVVNISFEAATAYCKWLEERINATHGQVFKVRCILPSREQWVIAGIGGDFSGYAYPWGNWLADDHGKPLCNYREVGDEHISIAPGDERTIEYRSTDAWDRRALYDAKAIRRENRTSRRRFLLQVGESVVDPVTAHPPNGYGLYNMSGNVAEMIDSAGVAIGGSWINTGYDVRLLSTMTYEHPAPWIGFRPILEIVEE